MSGPAIVSVETRLLAVPLPPFMRAFGYETINVPFVTIRDSDGAEGTGFTYTLDAGASSVCAMIDDVVAPALIGSTEGGWAHVYSGILERTRRLGATAFVAAVSAVDIAVWDLRGAVTGLPLWRLLHGERRPIRFYGSGRSGQGNSLDELVQSSLDYLSEGFAAVKISVGALPAHEDGRRVAAVREAVGPEAELMIDASERLAPEEALELGRRLDEIGLVWFEEPLRAEDVDGYRFLAQRLRVPLATGEHFQQSQTLARYLRDTDVSYYQPDAALGGGVTGMIAATSLLETARRSIAWHSLADLHVHLATAATGTRYIEDFPILDRILAEPLRPRNGVAEAPERPGHGIRWDRQAVDDFTVGPRQRGGRA